MDFAALMKSQINSAKSGSNDGPKRYLKRSEVEAQREAQYRKEQEEAERARQEKLAQKRKRDEDEAEKAALREEKRLRLAEEMRKVTEEEQRKEEAARRKRIGLPELPDKDAEKEGTPLAEGEEDLAEDELLEKLRDLGEPRRLFGETHAQRLKRYRKLSAKALAPVMSNGPIPTIIEFVEEKDMKVPATVPTDEAGKKYLYRQLASYFDMVLTEWISALARRPQEVKDSFSGKQATSNYVAARDNLKPLFRKMEKSELNDHILKAVNEIVDLAQRKRYVDANDAYLRLSIGKAAWPIGVTMVGIHERSAREKLHETEKGKADAAHILSDETTRKMLQGIKRCLSFAQTRWPPDDMGQLMG